MKHELSLLSAAQAAEAIRSGRISSEALVKTCLDRIRHSEPDIGAWAHLVPEEALEQARAADLIRKSGRATGALHGVPVGLKDIVDTKDMPTEQGSQINAGRRPDADARLVERLREAGAVIMGKTVTTEFAYLRPSSTRNPANTLHTPGGSSSGSAAAVAARHIPLAVGSQTGGSVIRPASFCGVFGFKPTRGTISRSGLLRTSATLDQVGVFANSLSDAALLVDVIGGYDQSDPASFARPRAGLLKGAQADVPVEPTIAWFDMPYHDRLAPDAQAGLETVISTLGARVERFSARPELADLVNVHKTIYDYEITEIFAETVAANTGAVSQELQDAIGRGQSISLDQYQDALAVKASAEQFFARFFNDFDAILSPAASGEAPLICEGHTGDAVYCTAWTLAGLPSLSLPLLVGENDLPVGVQLIGAAEEDDRLLRTAAWIQRSLAGHQSENGE
ncbi:amidase [Roseibium sp. AS2]|uniref:amidase n=1 Tax=Roseibium sp. AS2 TaxID=3135781 RepID=UPI00316FC2A8